MGHCIWRQAAYSAVTLQLPETISPVIAQNYQKI
jgi:hypothetical protein